LRRRTCGGFVAGFSSLSSDLLRSAPGGLGLWFLGVGGLAALALGFLGFGLLGLLCRCGVAAFVRRGLDRVELERCAGPILDLAGLAVGVAQTQAPLCGYDLVDDDARHG
jgi:hypothetical protein